MAKAEVSKIINCDNSEPKFLLLAHTKYISAGAAGNNFNFIIMYYYVHLLHISWTEKKRKSKTKKQNKVKVIKRKKTATNWQN